MVIVLGTLHLTPNMPATPAATAERRRCEAMSGQAECTSDLGSFHTTWFPPLILRDFDPNTLSISSSFGQEVQVVQRLGTWFLF